LLAPALVDSGICASLNTARRAAFPPVCLSLSPRRAQLKQGKIFKEIIEAMKDLVTDANLECGEEGLKLQVRARARRAWRLRGTRRRGANPPSRASRPRPRRRPWTRATSR
jgi:hypothetical protein